MTINPPVPTQEPPEKAKPHPTGGLRVDSAGSSADDERLARVVLMRLAEPGDTLLGRLIAEHGASGVVAQVRRGRVDTSSWDDAAQQAGRIARALATWRARLPFADAAGDLAEGERLGARLIVPGDLEWPRQLDDLGHARPYALWLHGDADLRFSCLRSVSVVGSRSATAYGAHVAAEIAASLGDAGWTVVSGGAYGIDAAAHRGALAGAAVTVAVLACGTDIAYPMAHTDLFAAVRRKGLIVSECAPGVRPTRLRFLVRNRVIAALSRGTLVVEAALRSGALSTAGHAIAVCRPVGAVPGPVTSQTSAGVHQLIRQGKAVCVTSSEEVIELFGDLGDDLAPRPRGPVLPRDALDDETRRVLEAMPGRGAIGPAAVAVAAGVDLTTALSCLGGLAALGFVERVARGWRLRRPFPR
jgi:DNA processing protein